MGFAIIDISQKYHLILIRRVMTKGKLDDFYTEKLTERTYIAYSGAENAIVYLPKKEKATLFSFKEANKLVVDFFPHAEKDNNNNIWRFSNSPIQNLKKEDKYMEMEIIMQEVPNNKKGH